MPEMIECPFCDEGAILGEPECCGEPVDAGYQECCGEPSYPITKCEACDGSSEISKQDLMELKLKGINPPTAEDFKYASGKNWSTAIERLSFKITPV